MTIHRIQSSAIDRQSYPREFHAMLESHGVAILPFVDMGMNQPLSDWIAHDLKHLLVPPWEAWWDAEWGDLMIRQALAVGGHAQPLISSRPETIMETIDG